MLRHKCDTSYFCHTPLARISHMSPLKRKGAKKYRSPLLLRRRSHWGETVAAALAWLGRHSRCVEAPPKGSLPTPTPGLDLLLLGAHSLF